MKEEQGSRFGEAPNSSLPFNKVHDRVSLLSLQWPWEFYWVGTAPGPLLWAPEGSKPPTLGLKRGELDEKEGERRWGGGVKKEGSRPTCNRQGCGELSSIDHVLRTWVPHSPLFTGRMSSPRWGSTRGAFAYENIKGQFIRMARGPCSSSCGSSHSPELLPLQEPPRAWISVNTKEVKPFSIIHKTGTLKGLLQWFSKCDPWTSSTDSAWEGVRNAEATKFKISGKVAKYVSFGGYSQSADGCPGKCSCPGRSWDKPTFTEHISQVPGLVVKTSSRSLSSADEETEGQSSPITRPKLNS